MTISVPPDREHTGIGHPGPRLSVLIVNYNGWDDVDRLVRLLATSPQVTSGSAEVVVVDNASPDPMPGDFLPLPEGVRFIPRADNGGFAVGVNEGWRSSASPWFLILNPDVEVDSLLIGHVLGRIESYEGRPGRPPGLVGFGLKNPDGSAQPSVGAFPSLFRSLSGQLIPRHRRKYQPDWRVRPGPVDWVTGACLLVNGEMLAEVGGMDEEFFLYYEEVALCRSAADAGWATEFDPSLSVVHLRPLQNRPISPKMRLVTRHSKLLYFRKHLPGLQFRALCRVVGLEAWARSTWSSVKGRRVERDIWRAIGRMARHFRLGRGFDGATARDLAEAIASGRPGATTIELQDATNARIHPRP